MNSQETIESVVKSANEVRELLKISKNDLTGKVTQEGTVCVFRGGYGDIYRGKHNETNVAIKRIRFGLHPEEHVRHLKVCL